MENTTSKNLNTTSIKMFDNTSHLPWSKVVITWLKYIINGVVQALNANWLTAVVYLTIYHRYDKTFIVTALIALVTSL